MESATDEIAPEAQAPVPDGNTSADLPPDDAPQAEPSADAAAPPPVPDGSALSTASGEPTTATDPNTVPPAPDSPAPPAPEPLRVRFFGRDGDDPEFALDGALRHADGKIEIPGGSSADRAMQLMARGREYERVAQPMIRQLEQRAVYAETRFNEAEARGNAIWNFLTGLRATARENPEIGLAFWEDFDRNFDKLEVAVERDLARQERAAAERLRAPRPEEQEAAARAQTEQAQSVFWNFLVRERAKHPHVTDADLQEMAEELWEDRATFIVTADYDDPANGVRKGQPAFNPGEIARRFARHAGRRKSQSTPAANALATTNAKTVAAATGQPRATPALPQAKPPAPVKDQGTQSAGQPRASNGQFQSREDYEREMSRKYGI